MVNTSDSSKLLQMHLLPHLKAFLNKKVSSLLLAMCMRLCFLSAFKIHITALNVYLSLVGEEMSTNIGSLVIEYSLFFVFFN